MNLSVQTSHYISFYMFGFFINISSSSILIILKIINTYMDKVAVMRNFRRVVGEEEWLDDEEMANS